MEIKETKSGNEAASLLQMSAKRRWAVTFGVMTGMFIAALEMTVIGTAMPTVIASHRLYSPPFNQHEHPHEH